jgi:hypothetical protein
MYLYLRGIAGMMALHHTCELSNDKVSSRFDAAKWSPWIVNRQFGSV